MSDAIAPRLLADAIARQRETVLDCEVALEDARAALVRDLEQMQICRRDLDREDRHLAHLTELATETPAGTSGKNEPPARFCTGPS